MQTAFSCRENLEDKERSCHLLILALSPLCPNQRFLEKAYFAKNVLFDK